MAILFGALASLAPLAWLAHNRFYYSNALEFYNGPWSAMAIYQRQLAQGMQPYPGDHDWRKAAEYYSTAVQLAIGWPALILAAAGVLAALWKRAWWPVLLLLLSPVFYVMGHALDRHADFRADALSAFLVQHTLRSGCAAAHRRLRRSSGRAAAEAVALACRADRRRHSRRCVGAFILNRFAGKNRRSTPSPGANGPSRPPRILPRITSTATASSSRSAT